jgi:hypothetical protein
MSKKARSEGNRVACLIKSSKAEFYTTDVDVDDNPDDMLIVMESVRKTLGKMKSSFMLIAGGDKFLIVNAYIPDELKDRMSFDNWVNNSIVGLKIENMITVNGDNYKQVTFETDFPFKTKDVVRSNSILYLSKNGCMCEEESSEEFIGFDDI